MEEMLEEMGIPDELLEQALMLAEEESEPAYTQASDTDLVVLAQKLNAKFDEVATARKGEIEQRWLEDYRAYHGKYSDEEERRFDSSTHSGSRAFANLTRPKTIAMEAKLSDILFPTDESNFGLKASKFNSNPDAAEKATKAMYQTIQQQLAEARDAAVSRDVIHYGAVFGTGIKKGPVVSNRVTKAWVQDPMTGQPALKVVVRDVPDYQCVPPWNFFPDMNANKVDKCEFIFERQYLTKKEMRDISMLPGIVESQMMAAMKLQPDSDRGDDFENDMRAYAGDLSSKRHSDKYELRMYHGPLCPSDFAYAGTHSQDLIDELEPVVMGEVWIVGNHVIKVELNPLDSGHFPYSVWCPEEDDTCVFGYGWPYLLRHPQKARNAAWRMLLDNAGMSVGPQFVIDTKMIYPADGNWEITRNKIWKKKQSDVPVDHAFKMYQITNAQNDLMAIFKMSRELADEETNMPLVSQSNESGTVMASKTGVMSMVMNSQNVTIRRSVKNWDDNVTIPDITRLYDWNMQFNPDPTIKTDAQPYAKGSSELLVKETQATNAVNLVSMLSKIPQFAERTDWPNLQEQITRAFQYDPIDTMISEQQYQQLQSQKQPQPSLEMMEIQIKQQEVEVQREKVQLQREIHQGKMQQQELNRQMRMVLAENDKEKTVVTLANSQKMSFDQAQTKLAGKQLDNATKKEIQLNEAKIKLATGSGL